MENVIEYRRGYCGDEILNYENFGVIEIVELICGTEVPCDAYVACDADTVWMVDDAGLYLVDDDENYIIE